MSGFAGSHLADCLLAEAPTAVEVWGCDRTGQRQ
ncbi:MAG: hypothetical protein ACRDH2_07525, partial [Anaerolineales bacterium]